MIRAATGARYLAGIALEGGTEIETLGSTTRWGNERGAEPDSGFYIAQALAVRGKAKIEIPSWPHPISSSKSRSAARGSTHPHATRASAS